MSSRSISLADVSVRFGGKCALDGVSIDIAAGEIVSLIGPSGSGKSTLLRIIAGLQRPSSGRVLIGGVTVADAGTFVEPDARRVGMVFQDYALFPHLTVADNVAYGLCTMPREAARRRVAALLDSIALADRAASYPHMLSGGERQRVALARALAPAPDILLLDEPFCSLDASLRERIRDEAMQLVRGAGTTVVLVTHDAADAAAAGGRVALMHDGALLSEQTPIPTTGVTHVSTV